MTKQKSPKKLDLSNSLKIVSFDIEQVPYPEFIWHSGAGFKVDKSLLLSCAFLQHGKKDAWCTYLTKDDLKGFVKDDRAGNLKSRNLRDKELVRVILEELNKADIILSWYGSRHDLPYLNGKAMMYGLEPCTHVRHMDVYNWARYKLSMSSNRLGNIAKSLGLDQMKGTISPNMWDRVRNGDYNALDTIAEYNIQDVVVLDKVYERLLPMLQQHPHWLRLTGKNRQLACPKPSCGSQHIVKWGFYYAGKGALQKLKCNKCGYVWH